MPVASRRTRCPAANHRASLPDDSSRAMAQLFILRQIRLTSSSTTSTCLSAITAALNYSSIERSIIFGMFSDFDGKSGSFSC
ncbi:hypothetical protein DPMN_093538 [Dreissena polymorpha]|uniref:Uncharacterized protein n=1 Tax=Dreissena polymorpha TaxID=45954 RepID=A0A9D4L347_DREPO|nr:hypothetical protein DPMN_093538 [Dreissena polymorpha]